MVSTEQSEYHYQDKHIMAHINVIKKNTKWLYGEKSFLRN
jgi:hypothetical protein